MAYHVKEIFLTLQGEGMHTGRVAVFCRFSGCNLWSGRESDRAQAECNFCDTDFVGIDGPGGGKFGSASALADAIAAHWIGRAGQQWVVLTGGEPLLQVDTGLLDALHARGFQVAVETNGTQPAPNGLDWVCVSPKRQAPLALCSGDELKLVFPQPLLSPESFEHLSFTHFLLQPMDGPHLSENTARAVAYCQTHPRWRLSVQTHKLLGLP